MTIRSTLDYLLALARLNIRAGLAPAGVALLSALLMFGNNVIFFAIWSIYFANFSSLRGWTLAESFWTAIPAVSWMNIVVGDPLCKLAR